MEAIEIVESLDQTAHQQPVRAYICQDHGRLLLNKVMKLDNKTFKDKFRMNKSTFEIISAEVIF